MNSEEFVKVLKRLQKEYPRWNAPVVSLMAQTSKDPFRILITTILSLRTKDQVTKLASRRLFAAAQTPEAIAKLPVKTLEQLIYPVGFYRNKAKQIHDICLILLEKYGGKVPSTEEELLSFKGVGRKTANLVLSLGFDIPAICVDTHVHRISNRLGFIQTQTPEKSEIMLCKKLPRAWWKTVNELLVGFGQTLCRPLRPKCPECPIKNCPSRQEIADKK
jgi:endonuclease-3